MTVKTTANWQTTLQLKGRGKASTLAIIGRFVVTWPWRRQLTDRPLYNSKEGKTRQNSVKSKRLFNKTLKDQHAHMIHILNFGLITERTLWSLQLWRNLRNCNTSMQKNRASTEIEHVTFAWPVRCSANYLLNKLFHNYVLFSLRKTKVLSTLGD